MGFFSWLGELFGYTEKREEKPKNVEWISDFKRNPLCDGNTYINGYTNNQREYYRFVYRSVLPFDPYPRTYRFYEQLD